MNYLYNGVELPALPEWDKEKYPYAVIRDCCMPGINSYCYDLLAYPVKPYAIEYDLAFNIKASSVDVEEGTSWLYVATVEDEGGSWQFRGEEQTAYEISAMWSNVDIAFENGTLYLAASDPVPVKPPNPTAMTMGMLMGQAVRRMRK